MEEKEKSYVVMTKEELIVECVQKDNCISQLTKTIGKLHRETALYGKTEIMKMYHCEGNKAMRILKLMYQYGFGNKVGREYYVTEESYYEFMNTYKGRELFI